MRVQLKWTNLQALLRLLSVYRVVRQGLALGIWMGRAGVGRLALSRPPSSHRRPPLTLTAWPRARPLGMRKQAEGSFCQAFPPSRTWAFPLPPPVPSAAPLLCWTSPSHLLRSCPLRTRDFLHPVFPPAGARVEPGRVGCTVIVMDRLPSRHEAAVELKGLAIECKREATV